jgi:hypothetical protein
LHRGEMRLGPKCAECEGIFPRLRRPAGCLRSSSRAAAAATFDLTLASWRGSLRCTVKKWYLLIP